MLFAQQKPLNVVTAEVRQVAEPPSDLLQQLDSRARHVALAPPPHVVAAIAALRGALPTEPPPDAWTSPTDIDAAVEEDMLSDSSDAREDTAAPAPTGTAAGQTPRVRRHGVNLHAISMSIQRSYEVRAPPTHRQPPFCQP